MRGTGCTVQHTICSHTGTPVGLLDRPVDGWATECSSGRLTIICQPGFQLNYLN